MIELRWKPTGIHEENAFKLRENWMAHPHWFVLQYREMKREAKAGESKWWDWQDVEISDD